MSAHSALTLSAFLISRGVKALAHLFLQRVCNCTRYFHPNAEARDKEILAAVPLFAFRLFEDFLTYLYLCTTPSSTCSLSPGLGTSKPPPLRSPSSTAPLSLLPKPTPQTL